MSAERDNKLIKVSAVKRFEKGAGVALWQGEIDKKTNKEKWVWFPASQIEDNGDGTFTMPEWLAKQKGFI